MRANSFLELFRRRSGRQAECAVSISPPSSKEDATSVQYRLVAVPEQLPRRPLEKIRHHIVGVRTVLGPEGISSEVVEPSSCFQKQFAQVIINFGHSFTPSADLSRNQPTRSYRRARRFLHRMKRRAFCLLVRGFVRRPIGQALATRRLDDFVGAGFVVNLAMVPAERELIDVALQVLL